MKGYAGLALFLVAMITASLAVTVFFEQREQTAPAGLERVTGAATSAASNTQARITGVVLTDIEGGSSWGVEVEVRGGSQPLNLSDAQFSVQQGDYSWRYDVD